MFNRNETLDAADASVSVGQQNATLSNVAMGICDGCYESGRLPQLAVHSKDRTAMPALTIDPCENGAGGLRRAKAARRQTARRQNMFSQLQYNDFWANCLLERTTVGAENSSALRTLYEFWTRFLVTNFNQRMYAEFKKLAVEDYRVAARATTVDAVAQCYFGIECLLKFYCTSLETQLRPLLLADFHEIALFTHSNGHQCGVHALLAFLRNRKDRMSLAVLKGLGELATQTLSESDAEVSMQSDSETDSVMLLMETRRARISRKRGRADS